MSYTLELKNLPSGISTSTMDNGESGKILLSGFYTDADGELFYRILKEFEQLFFKPFHDAGHHISQIDSCLVTMESQLTTVYINEFDTVFETIAKHGIGANTAVTLEDVVGVISLKFPKISIPEDAGIVYFFSIGWKRGLFFDFRPNMGGKLLDIEYILGAYYEKLLYSQFFQINVDILANVYNLGWFPFISLLGDGSSKLEYLIARIKESKPTEQAERNLIDFFDEDRLSSIHQRLRSVSDLIPHMPIIDVGIERYLAGDYVSSTNNIWPRIEGILRYIYGKFYSKKPSQRKLTDNILDVVLNKTLSPGVFFPEQFHTYLLGFYFRDFDLSTGQLKVSRHSIGHGVSDANLYDQKHALLGILMVDQLGFYLRRPLIAPK